MSKLTGPNKSEEISPSIGLQAGVGVQLTKNFGFDLAYTQMNQTANLSNGVKLDIRESGLELGLNATF